MLVVLFVTLSACEPAPSGDGEESLIDLQPCRLRGGSGLTSVPAECGRLTITENPAEKNGKTIELFVARVPALNPRFPDKAFTLLAGGPGQAATEFYADYASIFDRIHRSRDIVLVDQRGTGQSNMLDCPSDETDVLNFSAEYVATLAADCLAELPGDPRYYTTSVAVDDLDAVRRALGYATLDIYGASYGTRVAQHYLRRYPDKTRSVILDGVVPAEMILGPGIAVDAQAALDAIFLRCKNEPHCNDSFPEIGQAFARLSETLRDAAVELTLPSPLSGEMIDVTLDYNSFAGAVRLLSYTPTTAALLPLLLYEASENGNWQPLAAQAQMAMLSLSDSLSEGMHNAVVCTEDAPFFDVDADERRELAKTYLGQLQLESLEAICEIWPAGIIDEDFHVPLNADVPVMVLSGSVDPVTPPRYGAQAAQHLPNSMHIVADGHGHGVLTRACVAELIAEFVETASFTDLDTACVDENISAPFFTSFSGPEP